MRSSTRGLFLLFASFTLVTLAYLHGIPRVPFHPDESTNLFTSADPELFWENPSALFWRAEKTGELRQHYRLVDAPLTRNIIAAGRFVARQPALPADWDWSKTWTENEQQGSLPSPELLLAGRYAVGALFPFSLLLLFLAARRAANDRTAVLAALLLASNALVLLHTRRSMAEGALLFTQILVMWSLVTFEKRPWAAAIPVALAFSAKQTLAATIPVALLATFWQPGLLAGRYLKDSLFRLSRQAILFGGLLIGLTLLLHPFLWAQPFSALNAAVAARQQVSSAQQADRPEQTLNSIDKKLIGMIGSLYLTPPIFAETINYTNDTAEAEQAYLSNPLHSLFRSLPMGAVMLMLNLFGFAAALGKLHSADSVLRRRLALLIAATLLQTLAMLLFIPLPWQRYYLPLVPFACLWTAYGINELIQLGFSLRGSAGPASRAGHLPGK